MDDLVNFVQGPGYVLDFSNISFASFFAFELNVDIDDPAYARNGTSKGKRLRSFLQQVDNATAARTIQALWDRRVTVLLQTGITDPVKNPEGRFLAIMRALRQDTSLSSGQAPVPPRVDSRVFTDLTDDLMRVRALTPHERGFAFEGFLKRCFNAFGLEAKEPFRNTGEQIDGSFQLGHETYLLEAKWLNAPVGNRDLHAFHGKLEGKAAWTRGLFVSFGGFTADGLTSFGTGKRVICMEGRDLYEALDRQIPLSALLERKVRHAAETGEPFVPFSSLFPAPSTG